MELPLEDGVGITSVMASNQNARGMQDCDVPARPNRAIEHATEVT
jgi:hypothetical protein